jgi:hypothetical protein
MQLGTFGSDIFKAAQLAKRKIVSPPAEGKRARII